MLEYINQLRARGYTIPEAARRRSNPEASSDHDDMLVATFGLLPAAMSHASFGLAAALCDCHRRRLDR